MVNAIVTLQGEFEKVLLQFFQTNIFKRYLGSVADFLSSSCPSWLSDVDQIRIKGLECLNIANKLASPLQATERSQYLEMSLVVLFFRYN